MKVNVKDVVVALVDREREGKVINHTLLRNVLDIFAEIEIGRIVVVPYESDFETFLVTFLVQDLVKYYSRMGATWIVEYSLYHDYMVKAQQCANKVHKCLKKEKESS